MITAQGIAAHAAPWMEAEKRNRVERMVKNVKTVDTKAFKPTGASNRSLTGTFSDYAYKSNGDPEARTRRKKLVPTLPKTKPVLVSPKGRPKGGRQNTLGSYTADPYVNKPMAHTYRSPGPKKAIAFRIGDKPHGEFFDPVVRLNARNFSSPKAAESREWRVHHQSPFSSTCPAQTVQDRGFVARHEAHPHYAGEYASEERVRKARSDPRYTSGNGFRQDRRIHREHAWRYGKSTNTFAKGCRK